jgi:hypothetical protein
LHFQINGVRGYVPKEFVREYKILKSSLEFVVNTEEAEGVRNGSVENVTDKSHSVSSVEVNSHATSNLEAALNSIEQSGLDPDSGSGIVTETPLLDASTMTNLPYADIGQRSFFGSGASAEPVKSEVIQQPFEVVDGTTLYYETDGKEADSKLHLPQVQPTVTTSDSLSSIVSKQKFGLGNEPTTVPPAVESEQSTSADLMGTNSVGEVMPETQSVENNVAETVKKTEHTSDEKRTESIFVADKVETESVICKEKECDVQHMREALNIEHKSIDSVGKSEREVEVDKDMKHVIEEPIKEMTIKTEESKKYGEEEDEEDVNDNGGDEDDEDDEEDEDDDEEEEEEFSEEEASDEVTELPSTAVKETVEEVKSTNITYASSQPSDIDTLKSKDPGTVHLSLETDASLNDLAVDNSKADDPNLQESANDISLQVELQENLADMYESSKEVKNETSVHAHSRPLPASESKNVNINADQTESNVGSAEELEHTQIGDTHENVKETEGNGHNEQVDTHKESADTEDLLPNNQSAGGKEVFSGSGEVINSVDDDAENISKNLKKRNVNVHPELVSYKITDYNLEVSSEAMDEIKSNLYEESHADSTQEAIETTTATSEEQYYEVPPYEPSTEETTTAASTFTSEEPLLPVESTGLMSEEEAIIKPSGGLFSDITNTVSDGISALSLMFGGSSTDSHIPENIEEVNESEQDIATERIPQTDKAEDMNRKKDVGDTSWTSVWADSNTGHTGPGNHHLNEEEGKDCKLNFGLSLLHNIIKISAK